MSKISLLSITSALLMFHINLHAHDAAYLKLSIQDIDRVDRVVLSHDGSRIAVCHVHGSQCDIYSSATGKLERSIYTQSVIHSIAWLSNANQLSMGLENGTFTIYDIEQQRFTFEQIITEGCIDRIYSSIEKNYCALVYQTFSNSNTATAAVYNLEFYNPNSGERVFCIGFSGHPIDLEFDSTLNYFAYSQLVEPQYRNPYYQINVCSTIPEQHMAHHTIIQILRQSPPMGLCWSHRTRRLAIGYIDGFIDVFSHDGQLINRFATNQRIIPSSLAWTCTDTHIFIGSNNELKLWNILTGQADFIMPLPQELTQKKQYDLRILSSSYIPVILASFIASPQDFFPDIICFLYPHFITPRQLIERQITGQLPLYQKKR